MCCSAPFFRKASYGRLLAENGSGSAVSRGSYASKVLNSSVIGPGLAGLEDRLRLPKANTAGAMAHGYRESLYQGGMDPLKHFAKNAMGKVTEKEQKTLDENEKLALKNETRTLGNKREAEDRKLEGPMP